MADFNAAFEHILAEEGGWKLTNNPNDRGRYDICGSLSRVES